MPGRGRGSIRMVHCPRDFIYVLNRELFLVKKRQLNGPIFIPINIERSLINTYEFHYRDNKHLFIDNVLAWMELSSAFRV